MKIIIYLLATISFFIGTIYCFASSPDYQKILTISIVYELIASAGFVYAIFTTKGYYRSIPVIMCIVSIMVLWHSAARLIANFSRSG
jgi:hypothetical protein